MNKNLEDKYISVIEDNINVGQSNAIAEFFILLAGILILFLLLYFFADKIGCFFIDRMSDKTQIQIRIAGMDVLVSTNLTATDNKYYVMAGTNEAITFASQLARIETLRDKIVPLDKKLQGKSKFPIYEVPEKEINAFVTPNGTIFFTRGLLKEVKDEEILTFVLAHELGHYAHRDHLKSISREIIVGLITSIFTSQNNNINGTLNSISDLNGLTYSRRQELEADKFANNIIYQLYGNNDGAIEFFEMLEKKEKFPEFLQYFSTHPSTKQRLKLIKNGR